MILDSILYIEEIRSMAFCSLPAAQLYSASSRVTEEVDLWLFADDRSIKRFEPASRCRLTVASPLRKKSKKRRKAGLPRQTGNGKNIPFRRHALLFCIGSWQTDPSVAFIYLLYRKDEIIERAAVYDMREVGCHWGWAIWRYSSCPAFHRRPREICEVAAGHNLPFLWNLRSNLFALAHTYFVLLIKFEYDHFSNSASPNTMASGRSSAVDVSAGSASMPAPMAVPANKREAPKTLPDGGCSSWFLLLSLLFLSPSWTAKSGHAFLCTDILVLDRVDLSLARLISANKGADPCAAWADVSWKKIVLPGARMDDTKASTPKLRLASREKIRWHY